MALEPRRYDRILNEAPDDVLGAIFGFLRTLVVLDLSFSDVDDDALRHIGVASKGTLRRLAIPMCHRIGSRGVGHLVMRVVRGPAIQYSVDTPRRVAVPHR